MRHMTYHDIGRALLAGSMLASIASAQTMPSLSYVHRLDANAPVLAIAMLPAAAETASGISQIAITSSWPKAM